MSGKLPGEAGQKEKSLESSEGDKKQKGLVEGDFRASAQGETVEVPSATGNEQEREAIPEASQRQEKQKQLRQDTPDPSDRQFLCLTGSRGNNETEVSPWLTPVYMM